MTGIHSMQELIQVWAASSTIKGTFRIIRVNAADLINPAKLRKHLKRSYADKFILIDRQGISDKRILSGIDSLKYTNYLNAKGRTSANDQKLSWSVMIGYKPFNYPVIDIKSSLPSRSHSISLNVESKFYRNYKTQNVIGFIKSSDTRDTFLVFTAHYDHLGRMGKKYISRVPMIMPVALQWSWTLQDITPFKAMFRLIRLWFSYFSVENKGWALWFKLLCRTSAFQFEESEIPYEY